MDKAARMAKRDTTLTSGESSKKELSFTKRNHAQVSIKVRPGEQYDPNSIEHFIHQPINCGFLFAFCEKNYCAENIKFAMEIDKFRDYLAMDSDAWGPYRTWMEIDKEVGLVSRANKLVDVDKEFIIPLHSGQLLSAELWPSKKVDRFETENLLKQIWDMFLSDDAPSQICMPSRVLSNTIARLRMLHVYGEEVFSEAMLDPIKTIRVDIQPRFVTSPLYREMQRRLQECEQLPLAITLEQEPPGNTICAKYSAEKMRTPGFMFSLDDVLEDRTLYNVFLKYLDRKVCSENLRCCRAVYTFRALWNIGSLDATHMQEAYDMAWTIYKYFMAEESAYEISLSSRRRRQVMRELAMSKKETFDVLQKSAMTVLKQHFLEFRGTPVFNSLVETVLTSQDTRPVAMAEKKSCLG